MGEDRNIIRNKDASRLFFVKTITGLFICKSGRYRKEFFILKKMTISKIIKNRRSVRRFKEKPLQQEALLNLLEAARTAPSAGNVQPWKFYVVRNKELRSQLAAAALGQRWMLTAPVIIVVCADLARATAAYGKRGRELYALQDTAAAIENILLSACSIELACCWVGAFHEETAARVLQIEDPTALRPVALLPVGYPADSPSPPRKRPLQEIIVYLD